VLILSFENLLSPWNSFIVLTRVKSFQALALWQIDPELLSIEYWRTEVEPSAISTLLCSSVV